jgi:uncharacterized MAPEG superfamily protein
MRFAAIPFEVLRYRVRVNLLYVDFPAHAILAWRRHFMQKWRRLGVAQRRCGPARWASMTGGAAMSLAYWCVLLAGVMPVLTVACAKWGVRDFDNAEPRAWMDKLSGFRRRADYAHRNHFEAFPFFAAAVLIAAQLKAPQGHIDVLAVGFIACRIVYTVLYLRNLPSLRSFAWLLGYLCVLALFGVAAAA